jgi:hypothetical protein
MTITNLSSLLPTDLISLLWLHIDAFCQEIISKNNSGEAPLSTQCSVKES